MPRRASHERGLDTRASSNYKAKKPLVRAAILSSTIAIGGSANAEANKAPSASQSSGENDALIARSAAVPIIPEAFGFMRALSARAQEIVANSGQDPNSFIMHDPEDETKLMQKSCLSDEPTSLTFTQKSGKAWKIRVGTSEAQKRVALMSSRYVTNNVPQIDGTSFEGDCDLVDDQYTEAQPMWRTSKKAKFRAFGRKIVMRTEDLLLFKFPGSRASTSKDEGNIMTNRRVTAADRKKGKFGIKLTTRSRSRNPAYGDTSFYYGGVYRVGGRRPTVKINPRVTAPSQPFNQNKP